MQQEAKNTPLLVIGSGPAGLSIANGCSGAGVDVTLVSPDCDAPWAPQYAAWVDELAPLELVDCLKHAWPGVRVWMDDASDRVLTRAYGVFDNERLAERLRSTSANVQWCNTRVTDCSHQGDKVHVTCANGQTFLAELVVDASGGLDSIAKAPNPPTAFQTAYGVLARVRGVEHSDVVTLMDYRDPFQGRHPLPGDIPSFLYAIPWPDGRWFFEETVLVARPAVDLAALQKRLEARLAQAGVEIVSVDEVEHCVIPMDVRLPDTIDRIIPYGSCAGMVHPATGYSVVESLRRAPTLVHAIVNYLQNNPATTKDISDALWSKQARQRHALYQFGADVAVEFNGVQTREFLHTFFQLPTELWSGYLSRQLSVGEIQSAMLRMFAGFSLPLKQKMLLGAAKNTNLLVKGLFG